MNETLQNAVTTLITKTIDGAEAGMSFLEGQIPDYIHQLIMWHGWYNFILFVTGIILLIIVIMLNVKLFKYVKKQDTVEVWGAYIGGNALSLMFAWLPAVLMLNLTWLKIWIAPKVWLVEYAASLVK